MKKQSFNPFLPSYEYIPDAEPYVFDNRLYIFGSHDKFNGKTFCMNDYVTWSTPIDDLSNWRYEGVIYSIIQDPLYKQNQYMYAPDVARGLDGRYYLYYSLSYSSIISVAVSNEPAGKYQFYGHVKYKDGTLFGKQKRDPFGFDPSVFIDDNSFIYMYTGFVPKCITRIYLSGKGKMDSSYVTQLESDMITIKISPQPVILIENRVNELKLKDHNFFEAPSMRKIGNQYYYIYSSIQNHELCYAISSSPVGPFTFMGVLISNASINRQNHKPMFYYGNNHGSLVEINHEWYIFYHRQTNRHEYSRQTCAEKMLINPDGTFVQAEMTSCGLNPGPLVGIGKYLAHIACVLLDKSGVGSYSPLNIFQSFKNHPYLTQTGIDRNDHPDQYIKQLRFGSIVGYKYFDFSQRFKTIIYISGKGQGLVEVYKDLNKEPISTINITTLNEITSFDSDEINLNGCFPIYFKYKGKGFINLHAFEFQRTNSNV